MNGTRLVFEKWTRYPKAKIFQAELSFVLFRPSLGMKKFFQDARFIEPAAGRGEPATNLRAARLREALDQVADMSGFHFGDWHELTTASSTTFGATDLATLALFG